MDIEISRRAQVKIQKEKQHIITVKAYLPGDEEICDILAWCGFNAKDDWTKWYDAYDNIIVFEKRRAKLELNKELNENKTDNVYLKSLTKTLIDKSLLASVIPTIENNINLFLLLKNNRLHTIQYSNNTSKTLIPITLGLTPIRSAIKKLEPIKNLYTLLEKENSKLTQRIIGDIY